MERLSEQLSNSTGPCAGGVDDNIAVDCSCARLKLVASTTALDAEELAELANFPAVCANHVGDEIAHLMGIEKTIVGAEYSAFETFRTDVRNELLQFASAIETGPES